MFLNVFCFCLWFTLNCQSLVSWAFDRFRDFEFVKNTTVYFYMEFVNELSTLIQCVCVCVVFS